MQVLRSRTLGAVVATGVLAITVAGVSTAMAQLGPPPQTVYGSINSAEGPVAEDLPVEAYIGDVECTDGKGKTGSTGEGDARVTVYVVNVLDEGQREGCGQPGALVTIKIGDDISDDVVEWNAGIRRHDLTFGDVGPLAIPTVTPTVQGSEPTATPQGSDATSEPASTAEATDDSGDDGDPSATPTQGGVSTNESQGGSGESEDEDDGGMPIWAIVALVLGGVVVVGGGVGYMVARNRDDDDPFAPPGNP